MRLRPQDALRKVRFFLPSFKDDMDLKSLICALRKNIKYLQRLSPDTSFIYGKDRYKVDEIIKGQEMLLKYLKDRGGKDLDKFIKEHFNIYMAKGVEESGRVLFTGYFEPIYKGSLFKDQIYRYPIYTTPEDLIKVDLSQFDPSLKGKRIVGRLKGKEVIPYFTRYDIDVKRILGGRGYELLYLKDPLDVFFLHIQGSGRIVLPDGRAVHVGYASSNGRPYRSIGRYLVEKGYMDIEQVSMQSIRKFLNTHPELMDEVLNFNPSYVFFRIVKEGPLGNLGIPLTAMRSIALDQSLFPKAALCFVRCIRPVIGSGGKISKWEPFSGFMLVQDSGGAIRGPGRADIFWGSGRYAELSAGHLRYHGRLYLLAKKRD